MVARQPLRRAAPGIDEPGFQARLAEHLDPIVGPEFHVEPVVRHHGARLRRLVNPQLQRPILRRLGFQNRRPGAACRARGPKGVVAHHRRVAVDSADIEVEHVHRDEVLPHRHAAELEAVLPVVPALLEIQLPQHHRGQRRDLRDIEKIPDVRLREVGARGVQHACDEVAAAPAHEFFHLRHEQQLQLPEVIEPPAPPAHRVAEQVRRVAAPQENAVVLEVLAVREESIERAFALQPALPKRNRPRVFLRGSRPNRRRREEQRRRSQECGPIF